MLVKQVYQCFQMNEAVRIESSRIVNEKEELILFMVFCYELLLYQAIWKKANEIAKDVECLGCVFSL